MFGESNRAGLYLKTETNWGEAPSGGAFTQLRYTGESLDRDKQTARSEVIRPDRMTDELALLGYSISGDINGEMVAKDWDTLIAAALCNSWVTKELTTLTLAVDATTKKVTRTGGSFVTDGILPGTLITMSGFTNAGNNGTYYVSVVTATDLTLVDNVPATLATEAAAANRTIKSEYVVNGTLKPSFVVEKQFQDLSKYAYANGLRVSEMELDITAMNIIKLRFGFMGKDMVPGNATVTGSTVAASTTKVMTASANVGQVLKNDVALTTGIRSLKLTISNDLRKQDVVASQATGGIGYGGFSVKGSDEYYFEDLTLWQDVINHSTVERFFRITDLDGNAYGFYIPAINYTKGAPKVGGANQDIMLPTEWEAKRDATANAEIIISRVLLP